MNSSSKKFLALMLIVVALIGNSAFAAKPAAPEAPAEWVANIDKARGLIREKQYKQAQLLLETTLTQARKSGKNDQMYGRYMGLMGNALFEQGKNKEMIPFAEEALRVFYSLPPDQRPPGAVFFGNHSSLGTAYQSQAKFKQAEQQYYKAIDVGTKVPKGQVDENWLKICFKNLEFCLHIVNKTKEEEKVRQQQLKAVGE